MTYARISRKEKKRICKRVTHLFLTRKDWQYSPEVQDAKIKIGEYPVRIRFISNPFIMDVDVHETTKFITPSLFQRLRIYNHWKKNYNNTEMNVLLTEIDKNLYETEFERDVGRSVGK